MIVLIFTDTEHTVCHNNVAGDGVLIIQTASPKHAQDISVAVVVEFPLFTH